MTDSNHGRNNLPIDYAEVLERIGGDVDFLGELLKIYFEEFAEKRRLIQEALERNDFNSIRELGHSLKGASANLSLVSLRNASWQLEIAGREEKSSNAQTASRWLVAEFERLKDFLEKNPPDGQMI
jgi:HPt (histidine-containing phosphotransfer) domain-containing protein